MNNDTTFSLFYLKFSPFSLFLEGWLLRIKLNSIHSHSSPLNQEDSLQIDSYEAVCVMLVVSSWFSSYVYDMLTNVTKSVTFNSHTNSPISESFTNLNLNFLNLESSLDILNELV